MIQLEGNMTDVTIPMDDNFKLKAENYFREKGYNLIDGIKWAINQKIDEKEEFDIDNSPYTEEEYAELYSPESVADLLERIKDLDAGKGVNMTLDEMRAMLK
jgi:hypothetical protein